MHLGYPNFKSAPYMAWIKNGGQTANAHYPFRLLHHWAFHHEIPMTFKSNNEARLRFVEPVSITFDTFPDYARYEIIPFVWDCWPQYFEKMCQWLDRHQVRTAIFTSSQTAERIQQRFPEMNIMFCPEAVDISCYKSGRQLKERSIDVLEFGRNSNLKLLSNTICNYVCTKVNGKFLYTNEQLYETMGDAKVAITLPRSLTQPEIAGDIETLTQRYWECMLSRMVMVGHAPKEFVDLIGYNPVIELDLDNYISQIQNILAHIEDYQDLVDKNREKALHQGDWDQRIQSVMLWLHSCGYQL